jgi:hypothetical protein
MALTIIQYGFSLENPLIFDRYRFESLLALLLYISLLGFQAS